MTDRKFGVFIRIAALVLDLVWIGLFIALWFGMPEHRWPLAFGLACALCVSALSAACAGWRAAYTGMKRLKQAREDHVSIHAANRRLEDQLKSARASLRLHEQQLQTARRELQKTAAELQQLKSQGKQALPYVHSEEETEN